MNQLNPLTPTHVQQVLDGFNLGLKVEHFEATTFTSEDAAAAIGCELGQIAKSMCLIVGGNPVLLVGSGDKRISDAKLARHFSIGRKKIKLASADVCLEVFGYPPGGVSPVGHRRSNLPILIDETLFRWNTIYAAAGTPHDNFSLSPAQLQTITSGQVIDCVKDMSE